MLMKPLTSRLFCVFLLVIPFGLMIGIGACGKTVATPGEAERVIPRAVETVVDDFENAGSWSPLSAQGVALKLGACDGSKGNALQFEFAFPTPSGYVVAAKDAPFDLPDDYKFTFFVKGNSPDNTLEFKLIDKDGNTFWKRFENFKYPSEWTKVSVRKSQIAFAWGPAGGGVPSRVAKMEFAVSCGEGGSGTVAIDELTLVDLSSARTKFKMIATASSMENPDADASKAVDGDKGSRWASEHKDAQWIELDLGETRDFVGMVIHWEAAYAKVYDILVSTDRREWARVYSTEAGTGGIDDLYFGKRSARYVKIDAKKRGTEWGNSIFEISMKGLEDELKLSASSEQSPASNARDGDMHTQWQSAGGASTPGAEPWLALDLGRDRDIGGLHIHWGESFAKNYEVYLSSDEKSWTEVYATRRGNGGRDRLVFHESEARHIKIVCLEGSGGYEIRELELKGAKAGGDQNKTYEIMAEEAPRGYFPKYFSQDATYWTIVGVTEDVKEALFNEEGAFEVDREQFSIEPFLYLGTAGGGRLVTWADVTTSQFLERGYLPIPEVRWSCNDVRLSTRLFSDGQAGASTLYASYVVSNPSTEQRAAGKLFLAIRPFQVNPPWQKLNQVGGAAKIRSIAYDNAIVRVNDDQRVLPLSRPQAFGAAPYASGDITEFLKEGRVPAEQSIADQDGYGSGVLEYPFDLAPGESAVFHLAVPFHKASPSLATNQAPGAAAKLIGDKMKTQIDWWADRLDRVVFHVP
ncbi:MAG: discoidin domain-containing protein, partial [Candidatus Hydrogenedentota bacterium]